MPLIDYDDEARRLPLRKPQRRKKSSPQKVINSGKLRRIGVSVTTNVYEWLNRNRGRKSLQKYAGDILREVMASSEAELKKG